MKKIGIYDSGIGGLTVYNELKEIMPEAEYLYFGDTKNMPYGEKTPEELLQIADKIFKFFEEKKVDAVVMACNTTSAVVYDKLKDDYNFKIYPIIQSCAKSIADIAQKSDIEMIGVFATQATVNSGAYSKELMKNNSAITVFEQACPGWVKIVEDGTQNSPQSIELIERDLKKMLSKNDVEKIILGCTHYPYLMDILAKFAPEEIFINPARIFAEFITSEEIENGEGEIENVSRFTLHVSPPQATFFVSSNPQQFQKSAKMFCQVENVQLIK